jgi:WD40 repeat protein
MHIVCPNCHYPIEIDRLTPDQAVTCSSCGSTFQLEADLATLGGDMTGSGGSAGRKVGRFDLLEAVGQGSFGTVFRARDPELDRIVAVKVPRGGGLAGRQELARFLREARSAAQLRHPSIVSIHEVGEAAGVPYIVSDFVHGSTLADLLSARRLPFRESAELVAAVADALHYAHECGVVHRDVKPSNILIGPDGRPCVMDFGLAKRDAGEITMTIEGQVLGTPAYMSPEQAGGEGHAVDGRTDVYSLGVVLYQMLTGELPFRGTRRRVMHQVLNDDPRPPRSLNDAIPRDLETIALKAMAREPGRRYATARDLAEDLRRWLLGEPIRARPTGRLGRALLWAKRRPAAAGLLGVSALAVLALGGLVVGAVFNAQLRDLNGKLEAARVTAVESKEAEAEQRKKAEEARGEAERARGEAQLTSYFSSISHADRALQNNNVAAAQRQLKACPEHLRGWEWRHLNARCHAELLAITCQWVAFSPDGTRMVVCGKGFTRAGPNPKDAPIYLYDTHTGRELRVLKGPTWLHPWAEFSPDGSCILAKDNEAVRMYDADSGQQMFAVKGMHATPGVPMFSPDSSRLVLDDLKGRIGVYDARTGKLTLELMDQPPSPFAIQTGQFTPDGRWIVVRHLLEGKGSLLRFRDARTGRLAFTLKGLLDFAYLPGFGSDGPRIATSGGDDVVRLYDGKTGHEAPFFIRGPRQLGRPTFSPDGTRLAASCADGSLRIYDVGSGREVLALPAAANLSHYVFSPDGTRLVAHSDHGVARVYDTRSGEEVVVIRGPAILQRGTRFSPDGSRVVTMGSDNMVRLYDVRTEAEFLPLPGQQKVDDIAFSPDGSCIAASVSVIGRSRARGVRLVDARTGQLTAVVPGIADRLRGAFSPDGSRITTIGPDGRGRLHDARTGREVLAFGGPSLALFCPAFSADGSRIVARGADSIVRLYDPRTGEVTLSLKGEMPHGFQPAISFDGSRVAATKADGVVRVHDAASGRELLALKSATGLGQPMFSPDGTRIAAASADGMRLFDAQTGSEAGVLRGPEHLYLPTFSPDGTRLAAWGRMGWRVYDVQAAREIFAVEGTMTGIGIFSHDGSRIAIGEHNVLRVYDTRTGQEALTLKVPEGQLEAAFSPDSSQLVIAGSGPGLRVFAAPDDIGRWQSARRQALRDSLPAWHETRARECDRAGERFAAAFHRDRLAGPGHPARSQPRR